MLTIEVNRMSPTGPGLWCLVTEEPDFLYKAISTHIHMCMHSCHHGKPLTKKPTTNNEHYATANIALRPRNVYESLENVQRSKAMLTTNPNKPTSFPVCLQTHISNPNEGTLPLAADIKLIDHEGPRDVRVKEPCKVVYPTNQRCIEVSDGESLHLETSKL